MIARKNIVLLAAGALALSPGAALAQTDQTEQRARPQQDRVGAILSALFGGRNGASGSVESQWALGRRPLGTQQDQFDARIDADVRARTLTRANGERLKSEYDELVALETRYGADNRFNSQERADLSERYEALTQALSEGGYADAPARLAVAEGRTDFERRVDAGVSARRISRTQSTSLKRDYAALVQAEAGYARDGINDREQEDLDNRLDALDARVGDTAYGGGPAVLDNRTRLTNVERALSGSGLSAALQTQIRVELGDLTRLEAAYGRAAPSSDDRSYLERRITDLETRARVRR